MLVYKHSLSNGVVWSAYMSINHCVHVRGIRTEQVNATFCSRRGERWSMRYRRGADNSKVRVGWVQQQSATHSLLLICELRENT